MTGLVPSKDILTWAMPHLRKNKGEQKTPEMWCWAEKLSCMTPAVRMLTKGRPHESEGS